MKLILSQGVLLTVFAIESTCGEIKDLTPNISVQRFESTSKKVLKLCKELPDFRELKTVDEMIYSIEVRNYCYDTVERMSSMASLYQMFSYINDAINLENASALLEIEKKAFKEKMVIVHDTFKHNKIRAKELKFRIGIDAIQSHLIQTLKEFQ